MRLTVRSGSQAGLDIAITRRPFVIGRDNSCDLVVHDERVSRHHAAIEVVNESTAIIRDLESTNGTFVNGQRVVQAEAIAPGPLIQVGDTTFELIPEPEPVTAPPAPPAAPDPAAQSLIRRLVLQRTAVRRATILALGALGLIVVLVALLLTGVIESGGGSKKAAKPTVADIVKAVRPSTALVIAGADGQPRGSGTGWVLDASQGLIVTNHHVVNAGNQYIVKVGDRPREARIVGTAPCEDLAVLQVDDRSGLRTLPLGHQRDLRLGDPVVALGFPGSASANENLTATAGVVSVVQTSFALDGVDVPKYPNVIQTDTAINPGNSGGPLVDANERLVGVNSAGIHLLGGRTIEGQAYAIGVDRVRKVVTQLRNGHSIAWTGLDLAGVVDPSALTQLGLPAQPGLLATDAVPGTPAAKAGLGRTPALIVAVNGRPMNSTIPEYCDAIGAGRSGDKVTFSVITPGSTTPTDVRLTLV